MRYGSPMHTRYGPYAGVDDGGAHVGELRRLASIRRTVFRYLLLAGIVAVAGSLAASELAGGHLANRVFSLLLLAGFVFGLRELRRSRGSLRTAEVVVTTVTFASILGILASKALAPGTRELHEQGWHAFGAWAPSLYVLAYLVFGRRIGLRIAIAFYLLAVVVLAVYFVDLDGFKQVNDTHGHQVGDDLLVEVARRLRAALRESDTVARIGGDEFTVLTSPLGDEEGAEVVAKKLLAACSPPIVLNDRELDLGCSVGVARYPIDGQGADALMARADAAMYEAKAQGGHAVRFASQTTPR